MKKLIIFAAIMAFTTAANAQTAMSNAIDKFNNALDERYITNENTSSWELSDGVGRGTQSSTYFSMPKSEMSLINNIVKGYEKDKAKAYSSFSKAAGTTANEVNVSYGKNNQQNMNFGSHKDRNYRLLLVRDSQNEDRRTMIALVWYDGQKSKIEGSVHKIYGDDPQKVSSATYQRYLGKNFEMDMQNLGKDLSQLKELSKLKDIIPGNIYSYAVNPDSVTNGEQFLSQFGNARTVFLKYAQREGDYTNMLTGIANKMMALSKKAKKYLSADERKACTSGIGTMISATKDEYIKSLLSAARNNF